MWYRIELNKDGSIATCVEVEESHRNSRSVRYVEAVSREEACAAILLWHKNEKDRSIRNYEKRRRAGLCYCCGAPARPGMSECADCSDRKNAHKRAVRAGLTEKVARPHAADPLALALRIKERVLVAAALKNERRREVGLTSRLCLRRAFFREVLEQFDKLDPAELRAWLCGELAELDELARLARVSAEEIGEQMTG